MAKRKQKIPNIPRPLVKAGLLIAVVAIVAFIFFSQLAHFLKESEYFNITAVHPDPSLDFIKEKDLNYLKGQNIFTVDLKEVQERLALKYPQVTELRLTKHFPNEVVIVARKRIAFAQTQLYSRTLTIDANGIVLSTAAEDSKLPLILGLKGGGQKIALGVPLEDENLQVALRIIKSFKNQDSLASYNILKLDVGNLSQMTLTLSNRLSVVLDREAIEQRIKLLSVVLSQWNLDWATVKYVDLRFKEPIIGKK